MKIWESIKNFSLGTHYLIFLVGTLGGCGICCIGTKISDDRMNILIPIGIILMIIGILWWILFLKCPNCGKHLSPRAGFPKYCPRCGENLL